MFKHIIIVLGLVTAAGSAQAGGGPSLPNTISTNGLSVNAITSNAMGRNGLGQSNAVWPNGLNSTNAVWPNAIAAAGSIASQNGLRVVSVELPTAK